MLHVGIVEDEADCRKLLRDMIEKYALEKWKTIDQVPEEFIGK